MEGMKKRARDSSLSDNPQKKMSKQEKPTPGEDLYRKMVNEKKLAHNALKNASVSSVHPHFFIAHFTEWFLGKSRTHNPMQLTNHALQAMEKDDLFSEIKQVLEECKSKEDLTPLFAPDLSRRIWGVGLSLPASVLEPEPRPSPSDEKLYKQAAELGWNVAYRYNYHEILLDSIDNHPRELAYCNSATILQSSGYGKSRLVDEMAKLVFTIPLNVRNPREARGMAYPPSDQAIYNLFTLPEMRSRPILGCHYFFAALFRRVKLYFNKPAMTTPEQQLQVPERWREYLQSVRSQMYSEVYKECKDLLESVTDAESAAEGAIRALKELLAILPRRNRNPLHKPVKLMIYVDEAHTLTDTNNTTDPLTPSVYEGMLYAFSNYSFHPAFILFLSTDTQLQQLAPAPDQFLSTRGPCSHLIAPFTELPFDFFEEVIEPNVLTLEDVSPVSFMAKFGRPLYWTFLEAFNTSTGSNSLDSGEFPLLTLIESKLVGFQGGWKSKLPDSWTFTRKLAILDVVLNINYDPLQAYVQQAQTEMIASHMRTAFSIPQNRSYVRSGYPSEPILAQAALRVCTDMQSSARVGDLLASFLASPAVIGSIDNGQRGENVAKIILLRAYMAAVKKLHNSRSIGCRADAVPVESFLRELFSEKYANAVLNAVPDNVGDENKIPLKDKFKDAKIRFNHFAKLGDETGMTTSMAWVAFIRCMALIGWSSQTHVDIMIPILLWDTKISEWAMSGILIQCKCRAKRGTTAKYAIDQRIIGFFPPPGVDRNGPMKDLDPELQQNAAFRPYISLVMELGVQPSNPSETTPRTIVQHIDASLKAGKKYPPAVQQTAPGSNSPQSPSALANLEAPERRSVRIAAQADTHPRYNIFAYGCSENVYRVIREEDRNLYKSLLEVGEPFANHSRPELVPQVRTLKPFWVRGEDCYKWFGDLYLKGIKVHSDEVLEGVATEPDFTVEDPDLESSRED